jgi:poly(A) polymerase
MGAHLDDLLCLSRADITTKRAEKKKKGISMINALAERITELAAEDAEVEPLPKGVGNAIMDAFGIPPSRQIGEIKRALEAAVEAGEIPPQQESDFYVEFLSRHRARFGIK